MGRNASRMHGSQEFIPATVPQGAEMSFECNFDTKSRTFTKTGSGQSRTFAKTGSGQSRTCAKTGSGQRNEKFDIRNVSVGFDGPESSCAKGFFDTKTGRYLLWFWVAPAGDGKYVVPKWGWDSMLSIPKHLDVDPELLQVTMLVPDPPRA